MYFCCLRQNGEFATQEEWPKKWESDTLTYGIKSNTNDIRKLRTALNLAMTSWDIQIPIRLKYTNDYNHADITVEFTDSDPYFEGNPGVLAYAYLPGHQGYSGKIVFNDLYLWSLDGKPVSGKKYEELTGNKVSNPNATYKTWNIIHTLIHEIGHSLGLRHSDDPNAAMAPYYNGVLDLAENDIARIQLKYGRSTVSKRFLNWLRRRVRRW